MSIHTLCTTCALLNRFNTCKGKLHLKRDLCDSFIDNRAGCRRCKFVKSCKSLGKKIGIYYLCPNFEKTDPPYLDPSLFPDYNLYLKKNKKDKKVIKRKIPIIKVTNKTKKEEHKEKISAMDEAALKAFDSKSLMINTAIEQATSGEIADDWSPEGLIEKVVSSNYDPRVFSLINDGDIVKPDNPVRFMIEPHFMNISLFPRQLQIALTYFSAHCTKCSDTKFIREKIKVDTPIDEILDRTVFYKNGVCPKCGETRFEAIEKGRHGNYSTFIGLCGQRCVSGDTLVPVKDKGLVRIKEIVEKEQYYTDIIVPVKSKNKIETSNPSNLYKYNKIKTKIIYANGINNRIICSYNHPILTPNGYIEAQNLNINDTIYIVYGTNAFGKDDYDGVISNKDEKIDDALLKANKISQIKSILNAFTNREFESANVNLIYDIASCLINMGILYCISNTDRNTYKIILGNEIKFSIKEASVSSIQEGDEVSVYDVTIPKHNCFIGSGYIIHNSGKSVSSGIFAASILAQYMSLPNPITFMKQLESVTFRMSFVGLRYQDAFENLWQDFYNNITNTPWYKTYCQFLDEEGIRLGRELYKIKDSFAIFSVKGLAVSPSGPDRRFLRGKCIEQYSYINTSNGFIRIKDLSKQENLGKIYIGGKSHNIVAVQKQKEKKECLKITLKNGQYVKVSTDHRIPVYSSTENSFVLKEAKELKIGDYLTVQLSGDFPEEYKFDFSFSYRWKLPCKYQINEKFRLEGWNKLRPGSINKKKSEFILPTQMTPELGRIIGYLLSDGWINSKYIIGFYTTSSEKQEDFVKCFVEVFGVHPNTRLDKRLMYGPNKDLPGYCVEFSIKTILNFFESIGLRYRVSSTKEIPQCIMQAPRNCVLECVSAMFSCDGSISRTYKGRFYYASSSKKMIIQLQQLMLKLGYYCSIKRKGEHLVLNTLESINFYEEYTGLNKKIWRDALELGKSAKYSFIEYKIPEANIYIKSYINKELGITPKKKYNKFIDKNIVFVPITKIKNIGYKTVYDLEVDSKNHLFPANNILVHNTRIYASLDEICHFFGKDGSVKLDPDEVSLALDNSLYTVRSASNKLISKYPDVPTAHSFNISSPRSKLDKGMRLYKQAKHIPSFYSIKMATWEFNPNITRKDLNDRFLSDPIGAERDFGANPPFGDDLYIPNAADVMGMISNKNNSLSIVKYKTAKDSLGGKTLYPIIKMKKHSAPSVLAVDCGYSCITGDSLLFTNKGIVTIESLIKEKDFISSKELNLEMASIKSNPPKLKWKISNHKASKVLYRGKKPIYRVTTQNGRHLDLTEDHKILCYEEKYLYSYVEAKHLKKGQCICIATHTPKSSVLTIKIPEWLSKSVGCSYNLKMNPDLAYVMGSLFYEDDIYSDRRFRIFSSCKCYFGDKAIEKVSEMFTNATFWPDRNLVIYRVTSPCENVDECRSRNCGKGTGIFCRDFGLIRGYFEQLFFYLGLRCERDSIPWSILQADEKSILGFLAAFFEVCGGCERKENSLTKIYFTYKSIKVLEQLQLILQTLSFDSKLDRSRNTLYCNPNLIYRIQKYFSPEYRTFNSFPLRPYHGKGDNIILDYVESIEDLQEEKEVYDIVMDEEGEPCFAANGIYVHNCNSFALALMHKKYIPIDEEKDEEEQELDSDEDEDEEEPQYNISIACSGILEIMPKEGLPLSFPKIYEHVIKKIIDAFDVKIVAFDRWQSIGLRQSVYEDFGIDAVQYSVNMQDFRNLKESILSDEFIIPKLEQSVKEIITLEKDLNALIYDKPVSHLMIQILTSKDNGRIITKGDETSDDILRAVCLGYSILQDENYNEFFEAVEEEEEEEDGPATDPSMIVGVGIDGLGNQFGGNSPSGSGVTVIPGIGIGMTLGLQ